MLQKKKKLPENFLPSLPGAFIVHKMHFATNGAVLYPGVKWSAQFVHGIDQNRDRFRVGMLRNTVAQVENVARIGLMPAE